MTIFILGLLIFSIIGLLIFVPFGQKIDWQKNYRQQENIRLYQQQVQHNIAPELADELAQRLLADEKQLQKQDRSQLLMSKSAVSFSFILFFLLLLLPSAYYFSLNRFTHAQQGEQMILAREQELAQATTEQKNDDYITRIQNRLRQDPNNIEHWVELGKAYMLSNEFSNALIAYSNAERLGGSSPALLGLAATALYYQNGQKMNADIQKLIDAALQQDPQEVSILSLQAGEAFLKADYALALSLWQKILDSGKSNVERRSIIQNMQMAEVLQQAKSQ
ncbi:c-type cytochrome biogenesis protein [Haemophilus haemoglobinophilus]|nr:c-type cytochrome biogenesis protein [Canicola haemoglobinophilus]